MAHWSNPENATELERELTNHRPTEDAVLLMKELRQKAYRYGATLITNVPPSRYRALALTALKESTMWAMAAIALDPQHVVEPDPLFDSDNERHPNYERMKRNG